VVQACERLADQRGEQERAEEEGYSVGAEKPHRQRLAMPTERYSANTARMKIQYALNIVRIRHNLDECRSS
jgi:hypothetical protein